MKNFLVVHQYCGKEIKKYITLLNYHISKTSFKYNMPSDSEEKLKSFCHDLKTAKKIVKVAIDYNKGDNIINKYYIQVL